MSVTQLQVCKVCFLILFDIGEKIVRNVCKNTSTSDAGLIRTDRRVKHNPSYKYSEEKYNV